jgi:hypothetical protein
LRIAGLGLDETGSATCTTIIFVYHGEGVKKKLGPILVVMRNRRGSIPFQLLVYDRRPTWDLATDPHDATTRLISFQGHPISRWGLQDLFHYGSCVVPLQANYGM